MGSVPIYFVTFSSVFIYLFFIEVFNKDTDLIPVDLVKQKINYLLWKKSIQAKRNVLQNLLKINDRLLVKLTCNNT